MLIGCIALYLAASLAVGLWAATRVEGAADFALAGGRFGGPVVAAAVFATWFGAETVLGIPATYMKEGLRGLVADPFGAVACLAIVGLVFARRMHALPGLTLGDFFRDRFGRRAGIFLSLAIAASYIGWIAAQLVALGLAFEVLSHGAIDVRTGIVVGAAIVLAYTAAGGMWSVAATDLFQALAIVLGLGAVAWVMAGMAGGAAPVIEAAVAGDRMRFLPEAGAPSILAWVSAGLVVALGSVPQQDVLQRVKSARTAGTAMAATLAGAAIYFAMALVPIFLVAAAGLIDPARVAELAARDPQLVLPTLVLERAPLAVQVLFFGALVSAILSTASGALLAPAVMVAENVLRPLLGERGERAQLLAMRACVTVIAIAVTVMALTSKLSIYQLVNESGKVVLVSAFVPLAAGLFWRRATSRGAHAAVFAGLAAWVLCEWLGEGATVPPPLAGLAASAAGMVLGSFSQPAAGRANAA